MKLLRLKITDLKGFRSLQSGFEHTFRTELNLQEEHDFAPFVCAGPNGSGKSNLMEALAAIFYHMECMYLDNLPDSFRYDEQDNPNGYSSEKSFPDEFEIEYLIHPKDAFKVSGLNGYAHIKITKKNGESPKWHLLNHSEQEGDVELTLGQTFARQLLPEYILGYSSGENEILSLPFFKMRFIQFDEYWRALTQQLPYFGKPETRMAYLDSTFSQAILLCNLLFQEPDKLSPFREEVGVEELKGFRIIIRRSVEVSAEVADEFGKKNPALTIDSENGRYSINLMELLETDDSAYEEDQRETDSSYIKPKKLDLIINRLKRCASSSFVDEKTNILYLDYWVNEVTRQAFRENFRDLDANGNPELALFQTLQVLLMLNLHSVSNSLKADLYQSDSLYASETVPTLASDERIMRFKDFWITKKGIEDPVLLKSLSDGEHQLLHTLGLCLLFKNTNSLFLLDEPETHFNPDWRSNFISRLDDCFDGSQGSQEMLITTHTPFLISDSKPEKVLVFKKVDGAITTTSPEYNTFGASINKITMNSFGKRETIGGRALTTLKKLHRQFEDGAEKEQLITDINNQLGDSVEKILLVKTILDSMEKQE